MSDFGVFASEKRSGTNITEISINESALKPIFDKLLNYSETNGILNYIALFVASSNFSFSIMVKIDPKFLIYCNFTISFGYMVIYFNISYRIDINKFSNSRSCKNEIIMAPTDHEFLKQINAKFLSQFNDYLYLYAYDLRRFQLNPNINNGLTYDLFMRKLFENDFKITAASPFLTLHNIDDTPVTILALFDEHVTTLKKFGASLCKVLKIKSVEFVKDSSHRRSSIGCEKEKLTIVIGTGKFIRLSTRVTNFNGFVTAASVLEPIIIHLAKCIIHNWIDLHDNLAKITKLSYELPPKEFRDNNTVFGIEYIGKSKIIETEEIIILPEKIKNNNVVNDKTATNENKTATDENKTVTVKNKTVTAENKTVTAENKTVAVSAVTTPEQPLKPQQIIEEKPVKKSLMQTIMERDDEIGENTTITKNTTIDLDQEEYHPPNSGERKRQQRIKRQQNKRQSAKQQDKKQDKQSDKQPAKRQSVKQQDEQAINLTNSANSEIVLTQPQQLQQPQQTPPRISKPIKEIFIKHSSSGNFSFPVSSLPLKKRKEEIC